jgi:hypothetical protein
LADSDIEINLVLVDEASAQLEAAKDNISSSLNDVSAAQTQVAQATEKSAGSIRDFTVGASGAATAAFGLYGSFERINQAEISADRANLQVKTSTRAVEKAQQDLNIAITEHGANSAEAKAASEQLSLAQERLQIADEHAEQAQTNVNNAMMASAIQIIPSTITMVDSLSKAWKNFPDMTGILKTLSMNVSDVGSKAAIAAIGVGSFVGGFTLGVTAIKQFGDQLGPVGRALMVIVPAIIAAAAAVWMLQEGITLGIATAALIASGVAVGAMVANLQSYGNVAGLASGGVVDHPMLALIGEGGEKEIVMPLSQYEAQRTQIQETKQAAGGYPQTVTYITFEQHIHGDIVSPADEDRLAQKAVDKLDEELYRRRNS